MNKKRIGKFYYLSILFILYLYLNKCKKRYEIYLEKNFKIINDRIINYIIIIIKYIKQNMKIVVEYIGKIDMQEEEIMV